MPSKKDTLVLAQEILDDPAKNAETKRQAKKCMELLITIRTNHAEMLKAGSFEAWKKKGEEKKRMEDEDKNRKEKEIQEAAEREKKEDEMAEKIGQFAMRILAALEARDSNAAALIGIEAKAAGVDPDTLRLVCKAMKAKR